MNIKKSWTNWYSAIYKICCKVEDADIQVSPKDGLLPKFGETRKNF